MQQSLGWLVKYLERLIKSLIDTGMHNYMSASVSLYEVTIFTNIGMLCTAHSLFCITQNPA